MQAVRLLRARHHQRRVISGQSALSGVYTEPSADAGDRHTCRHTRTCTHMRLLRKSTQLHVHTRRYTHAHTHTCERALTHTHTRLSTKITHAHARVRTCVNFSRCLYHLSQCTRRAAVLRACVITDQSHVVYTWPQVVTVHVTNVSLCPRRPQHA